MPHAVGIRASKSIYKVKKTWVSVPLSWSQMVLSPLSSSMRARREAGMMLPRGSSSLEPSYSFCKDGSDELNALRSPFPLCASSPAHSSHFLAREQKNGLSSGFSPQTHCCSWETEGEGSCSGIGGLRFLNRWSWRYKRC